MSDEPGRETARQDEILEVLYWLEGEGFRATSTLAGVARFLVQDERAVEDSLERLRTCGYVVRDGEEFRLTEVGRREAARRFADEFGRLLNVGHGECNDPSCDCRTNPAGATECHAVRSPGGHQH